MAHKSYRIRTKINEGDTLLKVNLKQGIDTINILSLEINTSDTYQLDTSNYGVIVGRVLANNAFGVPNVKVSVFIPIDEADENDYVIGNTYPFKTLQTKDGNGVRYNVLPKDPNKSKSIGTFPNKRLVLDNDGELEVFDKYWKYTATTNESGDYMLFGIPIGTCQIHYDCDLSDIGLISQKPYDFINKGYDASLFNSPTEFKDDNLNTAVHILSQDKTIYVYPFWGDNNANNIGITRNDINLDYNFEPSCVFLGSSITDSPGTYIGIYGNPNGNNGRFASLTTSTGDIEIIRKREDGTVEAISENVKGIINGNGVWCYQIPMNLDRIGTDEEGNIVRIYDPHKGIPTRARVRMRLSLSNTTDETTGENTGKILIPNNPKVSKAIWNNPRLDQTETSSDAWSNYYEFGTKTPDCCFRDMYWGKIYSVKQYYPRIQFGTKDIHNTSVSWANYAGYPINHSAPFSCISSIDMINGFNAFPYTTLYSGAENLYEAGTHHWFLSHLTSEASNDNFTSKGLHFCFENDWINGCVYFPKVILQNRADGTLRYFGDLNDTNKNKVGERTSYNNIYYSGRHQWNESNGQFILRQTYVDKWALNEYWNADNDNTSQYSQVVLPFGLITRSKTSLGDNVFYYRCGAMADNNLNNMFYRLYATDLTLLGNISDVFDNLPNLAEKLPSTSALFPPIAPPKSLHESGMNMNAYADQLAIMYHEGGVNSDDVDMFGNWVQQADYKPGYCKGQYWGPLDSGCYTYPQNTIEAHYYYLDCLVSVPKNSDGSYYKYKICRYLQERCTLFFGCRVYNVQDFLHYLAPTFVNTSRISELAVGNDHAYNTCKGTISINGIIDRFDIIDNELRSLYASYNHNITRSVINELGLKQYIPTQLYMVDFEGRLKSFIANRAYPSDTYDEAYDTSYVLYRFGTPKYPTRYPMAGRNETSMYFNCDLLLMDNSFYMYFGLHAGFSAIDEFRRKYYNNDIEDPIANASPISVYVSSSSCSASGIYGSTVTITPSKAVLTPPFTIYLYKGHSVIAKGVTESTYSISSVESGFYSVEVIDGLNRTYKHDFVVEASQTAVDYAVNSVTHGIKINSIDAIDVSRIEAIDDTHKHFLIRALHSNVWKLEISEEAQISDVTTLSFDTNVKQVTLRLFTYGSTSCLLNNFVVFLPSKTDSIDTINGIPWLVVAPSSTHMQWDSKNTMNPSANAWKLKTSGLTIDEQREYLGKMAACVYGRDDMSLKVSNTINYTPMTICPNNATYLQMSETVIGKTTLMAEDNYAQVLSVNGSVNSEPNLPHLVAQNSPKSRHQKSLLKIKRATLSYDNNPLLGFNAGGAVVYTNANYFGIKSLAKPSDDRPTTLNHRDITALTYSNFTPTGYYKIQTVDKRFDYEMCIVTPVLLPSGYDNFTSLSNSAVISGKLNADIYGGLRLDYNRNDELTCYSDVNGNLEGRPTNAARLYQTQVFEDENTEYLSRDYISSNLMLDTSNQKINQSCNDYINIKHSEGLFGRESLNFNLIDCSTDITDNIVKSGLQMRFNMSYSSDIEFVHSSVYDDDYDIVYNERTGSPGDYLASLEGSSLKFTIGGDNLFNGSTYTDVKRDGLRPASTLDAGSDTTYPKWSEKFRNPYNSKYELCVLRMSGANINASESYTVTRTFKENTLTDVKDDSAASFFTYSKVEGENIAVNDSVLRTLSEFSLNPVGSGSTFNDHDYLIIPTRKTYIGQTSTLLNQASVINSGYAYYASQIHIQRGNGVITVQLFSPLSNNGGYGIVNYNATSLVGDGVHTVGNISEYYCPNGSVTYNNEQLKFTITITTPADEIPFYFIINKGLKYKVIINNKEESND